MVTQKLQSEILYERTNGLISKEDSVRLSKENLFLEIRQYLMYFESKISKNMNDLTEEQLMEAVVATKFFCRI